MSVESGVWSAALALLFFGGGWLAGRTVQRRRGVLLDSHPARSDRPTAALLASRAQAIAAEASASRALGEERRRRLEAEEAHDALLAEGIRRDTELTTVRARAAALERALADAVEHHTEERARLEVLLDARERALAAAEEALRARPVRAARALLPEPGEEVA